MFSPRVLGICLAGAATALIAAAQTSPEDATSNLAGWYELIAGTLPAPDWLANPIADQWGVWAGVAGLLTGVFLFIFSLRTAPQTRTDRVQRGGDETDERNAARRDLIRRWREAALAAQKEADELERSRIEQLWPDNMIGMHEVKHILQTKPEYHEFNRVYRDELLKSRFYKRWKLRMRISRFFGRGVEPLSPNPDRTSVVGTQLHSHVYYMLRDIDRLEQWWKLHASC